MTNQAAQTMPELPDPAFVTPDDNLYTVHQMRAMYQQGYAAALSQTAGVPPGWKLVPVEPTEAMRAAFDGVPLDLDDMLFQQRVSMGKEPGVTHVEQVSPAIHRHEFHKRYRAMLAAAPAASGVHPDALPDGTLSKSTAKRLAAASVSERARELRERAEAHGGGVFVSIGDIRVIEQALTQQRGEVASGGGVPFGHYWVWKDGTAQFLLGQSNWALESACKSVTPLYTTPQPSAAASGEKGVG